MTRPRILAIDDTPANLLLLGAALDAEFELQIATSGALGLALAAKAPPDLILLDVMMPEMDGYETCRRIKADPRLRSIPLVFVTALTENDAESAGLALGAVDYITKPVNVEIARQRLRNLLEREQLRKALEAERDMLEQRVAERTAELLELSGVREAALTAAEQLSALKTQFISNMRHELRTPLHLVIGLAALTRRAKVLAKAQILQVLTQLLGNAVKFTTQGKVSLTLRRDAGQLEFAVSDTGIGMTAEQLAAGFNPFQQTDGSATRRFGGLGLGLALIQRLAQLMGGKIRGTSQPGQGTTFYFSLPLA
ncbi:MAG: ATP-binding protein [Proteobacteria bacterium]|nr:ATP-binding protein [Pseudomonadota bacterium]